MNASHRIASVSKSTKNAKVLNYGQSIFEGMKAQRTYKGRIVLFRPRDNAARMREGAARMSMAAPPEDLFLDAVTSTVRANAHMVPPEGKGSLYLRPLLLGTGPIVGLGPAPSFTFTCFGTAVGSYFVVRSSYYSLEPAFTLQTHVDRLVRRLLATQAVVCCPGTAAFGLHLRTACMTACATAHLQPKRSSDLFSQGGQMAPIDLLVETHFHRAAPGGMGGTKCAGNYSPVLLTQLRAKEQGFADVVYLDAVHNRYVEEVSSCNIFVVSGDTVRTPPLNGTILPGVTRRSVCELLKAKGYEVREEEVSIEDACGADEVFTTGTAVVISSVGSLTHQGECSNRRKETACALSAECLNACANACVYPCQWLIGEPRAGAIMSKTRWHL